MIKGYIVIKIKVGYITLPFFRPFKNPQVD